MKDLEAIQKLRVLESNTTSNVQARVLVLIKLIPFFAQSTVSSFIEQNKLDLPNVRDLILTAQ